jgi:DNA-binding transcriptional ArsR family regulator
MELIGSAVWQALQAAGLQLLPVAADQVEVRLQAPDAPDDAFPERVRLQVIASRRSLSPSDLRKLAARVGTRTLVVVPAATPAARATAAGLGWSLVATNPRSSAGPDGEILLPSGQAVPVGATNQDPPALRALAKRGRVPWGALLVLRRLAEGAAGTQAQLAELAGVTQPRVSQTLKELNRAGLVCLEPGGQRPHYAATDRQQVRQRWLQSYPGPGGISTYWYGLDDPASQAKAVVTLLREQVANDPAAAVELREPIAVVSGDVAADQVAPWRRPQRATVYARRGADLAEVGLTPVSDEDATLELTVPRDPGVWPVVASKPGWAQCGALDLPLADPLQILWDVQHAPGPDRDAAAERLIVVLDAAAQWHGAMPISGVTPPSGGPL